jgi:hypothetical protein
LRWWARAPRNDAPHRRYRMEASTWRKRQLRNVYRGGILALSCATVSFIGGPLTLGRAVMMGGSQYFRHHVGGVACFHAQSRYRPCSRHISPR